MESSQLSLYRREAVEHRRDAWLGRPRLIQPISIRAATILAVLATTMIVTVLSFGEYTRRVRVSGTVVPSLGVSRIFTPATGRILSEQVKEGETVTNGSLLYTIALDSQTEAGETGRLIEKQLLGQRNQLKDMISERQSLNAVQKVELVDEAISNRDELAKVREQIDSTSEYVATLQKSVDVYRKLADQHLTVSAEFEYREQNFMAARQQLQSLQRDQIQLTAKRTEIEAKIAEFDKEASITLNDYRQRISSIDQTMIETEARRSIDIVAPRSGVVTGVVAHVGQMVPIGSALASIIPDDDAMDIQLLAESRSIGFLQEGQKVLLRYSAYPYQKFGQYPGTVTSISRVSLVQGEMPFGSAAPSTDRDPQRYRIMVKPEDGFVHAYGKPIPIKPGMAVEASIQLDTRHLYQWILEPLYSLKGSIL